MYRTSFSLHAHSKLLVRTWTSLFFTCTSLFVLFVLDFKPIPLLFFPFLGSDLNLDPCFMELLVFFFMVSDGFDLLPMILLVSFFWLAIDLNLHPCFPVTTVRYFNYSIKSNVLTVVINSRILYPVFFSRGKPSRKNLTGIKAPIYNLG